MLIGTDRPKVARALRRLRERTPEEATEVLSALETSGEEAVAAANALGLFATDRRLVVVDDVERWKAPDLEAVQAYLRSPAPTTIVAFVGRDLRPDAPFAKAVAKVGDVLVYDLPKRGRKADLPGWVATQFTAAGAQADADACRTLVALVGDDLEELAAEVEKLATWAAGAEAIGQREVADLVAPRAETPPFALTDGWGRRDVAGVLAAADQLIERSGESAREALPRIIGLLTSHVGRVSTCQRLAAEDVPPREAAERLKKNRFYVEKLYEQAANFTADELGETVVRLARLDLALKGSSRLPAELEFDRALIEITRPARPSAA